MKIHSLSTNSPPPCWWKVRWRFIALQQNVTATRIDLKRCYSHTHTHTYFEAKVFTVVAKLKPLAWTQSEEDAWAGTTAMKSAHNISRASLSLLSHPGRETHSTHLFIFLRHWKHLGNDWIFLLFGGRQTYPLAARSQKVKLRSILWTFCNDCHGWRWKNNSPLFVLFVCFPPWPLNYSLKKKRKNNNNTQFRDNLSVRTVAQPSAWYCKSVSCRRGFCAPRLSLPPRVCVCSSVSVFRRQVCTVTKP